MLQKLVVGALTAVAAVAGAQNVAFTQYLGKININGPVLPLAADDVGTLYYGTFNGPASGLYAITEPESWIDQPTTAGQLLHTFPEFQAGRGLQSIQVVGTNKDLVLSGDTGDATLPNLWRFNRNDAISSQTFTPDPTFSANAGLTPARRSGVSIFSDTGNDGVIIANGFNNIDFFDFSGTRVGGPFNVSTNYMREGIYNSTNNVFYPLRNGAGTMKMLVNYVDNVNVASGGTVVPKELIVDGAANGANGAARQNGFYYAPQNQLITMDTEVVVGGKPVPPNVRVWDIKDDGTSLSLAYKLSETDEGTTLTSVGDAVVVGNRLYISSSGTRSILVYGPDEASVKQWGRYEDAIAARTPAVEH